MRNAYTGFKQGAIRDVVQRPGSSEVAPGRVCGDLFFYFDFDWRLRFDAVAVLAVETVPFVVSGGFVVDGRFVVDEGDVVDGGFVVSGGFVVDEPFVV